MPVTKRQISLLKPFLVGDRPKENGEWDLFCPLHSDVNQRSASMNVLLGEWFCFAGCGGGRVADLVKMRSHWVDPPSAAAIMNGKSRNGHTGDQAEVVTNGHVGGWSSALLSSDERMEYLVQRGISIDTMEEYEIGWDSSRHVYTIPVRDSEGELANVRRYNPKPPEGRPKIRSVTGMGSPRLYPLDAFKLAHKLGYIIICEGEWDALVTLQNGFPCITKTAAADVWRSEWSSLFKGLKVYLGHDNDSKGAVANRKIGRALLRIAEGVYILKLPYPYSEKHGKDLTDFWKDYVKSDFQKLLEDAPLFAAAKDSKDAERIAVLDSFDATRVGKPVRLSVTIKGRREPGYTVPQSVNLSCSRDAGVKCNFCPLNPAGGDTTFEIEPSNPRILALLDVNQNTLMQQIATEYGVPGGKCARLVTEVLKHQAIEILIARPSLDNTDGSKADSYKNIKITSVGRHDTLPNNTVDVTGALHANPRTQMNDFLAWEMERTETSVDHFELTPETIEMMKVFQTNGRPLRKLKQIADEMSSHVTHILGRPEMHALMDLTFHSVLAFNFAGRHEARGWLDCLVIGDTRTGKSEAASALVRHYGVGEVIGGEMASVAGIIGGAQQLSSNDWLIAWGAVPLNDRRIVIIDEASGLSHEDIAALSDVRASGVAKITKIVAEASYARTRLLWLSNPRNAKMSDFTYGVDAIRPLVGNNEDIARFDMAMSVSIGDVSAKLINVPQQDGVLAYSRESCHALVLWCWTRTADQILWVDGADKVVLAAANDMGSRYVEDPPLIQAANVRIKIARTAIALAARLFSTDETYENIVVKPAHVRDAVAFMDRLYSMGTFGYAERSRERLGDAKEAQSNKEEVRRYIDARPGLAKFLRSQSSFRRQDLEEMIDVDRVQANATINTLWEMRMIRKEQANIKVEPALHELLREIA